MDGPGVDGLSEKTRARVDLAAAVRRPMQLIRCTTRVRLPFHFHGLLYEELTLLLETLGWTAPPDDAAADCPRAKRNWNATRR